MKIDHGTEYKKFKCPEQGCNMFFRLQKVICNVCSCLYLLTCKLIIVSVHCQEEGCIGKYIPRGPRDFPRAGILHPEAREISRGRSPREISRAEGCKIHARGKSRGPRGMYFPMHPDSRQCTSILSALAGKYWFCGVFFIWNLKDLPHSASACTEWALHQPKLL